MVYIVMKIGNICNFINSHTKRGQAYKPTLSFSTFNLTLKCSTNPPRNMIVLTKSLFLRPKKKHIPFDNFHLHTIVMAFVFIIRVKLKVFFIYVRKGISLEAFEGNFRLETDIYHICVAAENKKSSCYIYLN